MSPRTETDAAVLQVRDLSVAYRSGRGWVPIVDTFNLDVDRGQIVGIVGESGSGKTVASLAVMGLLPERNARVERGSILFSGREMVGIPQRQLEDVRGRSMAMVFQEPMTSLNPAFTVGEQIAECLRRHERLPRREAWRRAVEAMDRVKIPVPETRARSYPHELSGGMRQRVAIAMAIVCKPSLIIADEPTTALDVTIQAEVLQLLSGLRDELGTAIVFITHDLGTVAELCDRVAVMYAGEVVEEASVFDLFERPHHPYTTALLASVPDLRRPPVVTRNLVGSPPRPGSWPSSCRFAPRCAHAMAECRIEPIAMREADGHRSRCLLGQPAGDQA